ncbi:GNAT family N-acetyltransferase [Acidaminobacter sp. JC074]|uniref:GNAT family N-acetyltransferase n=1 Tax=Acidaminobacter sp. JC074 TaxID=2530199 RepID=UPI001F10661E|nr:GNAT family N-acetyltransferase [Acidaminobacter sp. JC074]MCH4889085.1 GNAT family N-acetyltransferase [Acidaminobacter sp. JC074]
MLQFKSFNRDNYEEALKMCVGDDQKAYVPSVLEALAYAYIKPWDEAFDPYLIYDGRKMIGMFYLSYTPDSKDNYWLGGFFIDKKYQGLGYGKKSLSLIIEYIKMKYAACQQINLTVVKDNKKATGLYKSLGFKTDNKENRDGEIIFTFKL